MNNNLNFIADQKHCYPIMGYIKTNHYLKSFPRGSTYQFILTNSENKIVGAATVGRPVGAKVQQKYSIGFGKVLELTRLVVDDNLPKNTESWFIGQIMRWIKNNTNNSVESIISYANPTKGHTGVIYKASNFIYLGKQKYANNHIFKYGKQKFTLAAVYRKTKTGEMCREFLKKGLLKIIKQKPKHIFIYPIHNRQKLNEYFSYGFK